MRREHAAISVLLLGLTVVVGCKPDAPATVAPIDPAVSFKKMFPNFRAAFDASLQKSNGAVKVEAYGWTFDVKKTDSLLRPYRGDAIGLKDLDMDMIKPNSKIAEKVTVEFGFENEKWTVVDHDWTSYSVTNLGSASPNVEQLPPMPGSQDRQFIDAAIADGQKAIAGINYREDGPH